MFTPASSLFVKRACVLLLVLASSAACSDPPSNEARHRQVPQRRPLETNALFDVRAIARGSPDTLKAHLGEPVKTEISHGGVQQVRHYALAGGARVSITTRFEQTRSVALWPAQPVPTPDDLLALVGLGPDDLLKTSEGPRQVEWVDPSEDITVEITAHAGEGDGWTSLAITVAHIPAQKPGK